MNRRNRSTFRGFSVKPTQFDVLSPLDLLEANGIFVDRPFRFWGVEHPSWVVLKGRLGKDETTHLGVAQNKELRQTAWFSLSLFLWCHCGDSNLWMPHPFWSQSFSFWEVLGCRPLSGTLSPMNTELDVWDAVPLAEKLSKPGLKLCPKGLRAIGSHQDQP